MFSVFLLVSLKINYNSIVLSKFCLKLNYFLCLFIITKLSTLLPVIKIQYHHSTLFVNSCISLPGTCTYQVSIALGCGNLKKKKKNICRTARTSFCFFQFYTWKSDIGIFFSEQIKGPLPSGHFIDDFFLFLLLLWLLPFSPCSVLLHASFHAHTDACSSLHPPSFT